MSTKIAIIGVGNVGATIAYALISQKLASELLLVDNNIDKCSGELLDLQDAAALMGATKVSVATLTQAGQADIIIISAGMPQKIGELRHALYQANARIIKTIIAELKPHLRPSACIIIVTNPVDLMTKIAVTESGLPAGQVFGSGTLLDTTRLQILIAQTLHIPPNQVSALVIGEHGDSQVPVWSATTVAGEPASQKFSSEQQQDLARKAMQKAYEIIRCKGATYYGVAWCVATYCHAIINDTKRTVPVSSWHENYGTCFSMPAVIGKKGIETLGNLSLTPTEQEQLAASIQAINSRN